MIIAMIADDAIIQSMNSKHRKTLQEVIFSDPINGNIEWRKLEIGEYGIHGK